MDFLSLLTGVSLFFINFSNGIWLAQCDCILIEGQQETEYYDESQGPTESINGNKKQEPFDSESDVMCYSVHFSPLISLKDGKTILSLFFFST